MKFPLYWAKGDAKELDEQGNPKVVSSWGWSDLSLTDAKDMAVERAQKLLDRLKRGEFVEKHHYGYGRAPMREEVIQRIEGPDESLNAAITQNSYGVLVLNTARVMFVDLDFDYRNVERPGLFTRLFGKSDLPSPEQQEEDRIKQRVAAFLRDHPQWGIRMYRTCAGIRLLVTHDLFDPNSPQTKALLQEMGSDPVYIQLCQTQECFRARLTPKPWRCEFYAIHVQWPRNTKEQEDEYRRWQSEYEQKAERFATCRYLDSLGNSNIHPDLQMVLGLHDQLTQCEKNLPLA